ncbi:hypothetical protein C7451_11124 [Blastomonas natatoria]|uniref:Uncharacterized protein n=1 Tax=Blastomonas natatoria TaxID=34015 RepID=A0A2V3UU52_9SPHN|nr:hypothetical protein [Blastomonas natatoria]PXW72903.1 hypothetical protein C7451_11124 [Blastomonas natatoria]
MTDTENRQPTDPVDCTDETAQRAGAKKSSLNEQAHGDTEPPEPDVDKDNVSEDELDDALDDSMDASDPPAFTQP